MNFFDSIIWMKIFHYFRLKCLVVILSLISSFIIKTNIKYKIQHITMIVFKFYWEKAFFIPILLYFFTLLNLLPLSMQQTWKTYSVFDGYLPSYIYPLTLNAGDFLRGYLNWPNSQDLDIYLYQQSQDLLSSANLTYLKRQYSPTTKPQILEYNITSSDTYFLRVDLYSSTPTAYQFDISVNGQLISTNFDTIIKVAAGKTVQQFQANGPCRIRVKYDGPIYDLLIFSPGANVISGTTFASDTSNTNPKYLDASLTAGGIWSLVVHHRITSSTVLTPFRIVIQTQNGVDQCINFCSLIDYTEGAIIGYSTTCHCVEGFQWVSANQTCSILCSVFNTSSDVGSRISGTSNQCQCLYSGFTWNTTYFMCVIDCTTKSYATGINTNNSCLCQAGFYWDASLRNCIRDCSGDANSISVIRTIADISTFGKCICAVLYNWNANTSKCQINCTLIPFASTDNSSIDNCLCQSGFDWSSLLKLCMINCSSVFNSLSSLAINNSCSCSSNYYVDYSLMACVKNCTYDPYSTQPIRTITNVTSLDTCVCITYFVININTGLCQIDCQLIQYSNGTNTINSCICNNQFLWDSNFSLCVRDCSNVTYGLQPNRTQLTVPDFCECQTNYSWNAFLSRCQLDCTLFLYTNSSLAHGIDQCICISGFYWQSGPGCLRDCSIISYAVGNRTNFTNISNDACACVTKFEWNVQTNRCEINCTNINNTQTSQNIQYYECMCANNFTWDPQLEECIINCNGISHTQPIPVANMTNYYTCQCISTFSWNYTFNRCQVICSSINYTDTNLTYINTNNASNLSFDQCFCIAGFVWDHNTNICQLQNIKPSAQIYIQRLSWTSGGVCGRQLNLTITEQKKLLHPISHYTQIQLLYGQKALINQYYANTDWKVSRVQFFDNQFTVNLTLQLLSDPTNSNFIIKFKTSGVVYDYFYAYADMPTGMAPAFYSQSECSSFDYIENVIKFVFAASYVVMGTGAGSLSNKIIGLELFGVLQLAYFSVSSHYSDINMYIYPIVGLKASNGANFDYYDQNNDSFYQSMPNVLKKDTKINGYFANNFNVMFLILVGFSIILGTVYGISSFLGLRANGISNRIENTQNPTISDQFSLKEKKQQKMCIKVKQKSLQILKQGLLTLIMFSIFNISFSAGVFFTYCESNAQNSTALTISKLVMYISFAIILVLIIDFVRTGSSTASFGEFKESFKLNWLCRMYIVISLIYRIVLGFVISLNLNDIYGTLIVLFISITFILFNIINLPFKSVLHNYRANFIHLTQFFILFVANYYRSMKANTALNQKSHIHSPAMIMIVLLVLSLIFSLIVALYESIIKIITFVNKCKKMKQQKENQENQEQNRKKLRIKQGLSKTTHHLNVTEQELVAD